MYEILRFVSNSFASKMCMCSVIFILVFLPACSSREIDPQVLEQAKEAPRFRMGLVTISEPTLYEAKVVQYRIPNPTVTIPGRVSSLGMIAVLKNVDKMAGNYNLTGMLHEQGYAISESLSSKLKQELKQVGYDVVNAPLEDHRHASNFRGGFCLNNPPLSEPCSNYFLHVVIDFAGYTAAFSTEPFVPLLQIRVQVISVTGNDELSLPTITQLDFANQEQKLYKLIYAATFTYGGLVPVDGPTDVIGSAKFALRGSNDLDNHQRIIAGLEDASKKLAKRVALNLR